ncbi:MULTISPECIES: GDP-mannose 4,6-dehydratase [Microbacterium]|uniref:NAD-dependent epimerase/dehydratase family protein n=1 Tax=Microbacterium TaxID=33882 RepID=UPI0013A54E65|nr:GDP-mannose 4,6-dehydratase [Microbacterium sp. KCTC 39802]
MNIVVTGADGFVGQHVVKQALQAGHEVRGIRRSASPADPASTLVADLTERWPVPEPPDGIIHLASLAAVGRSFDAPQEYISANTAMLTRIGEGLLAAGTPRTRVIVVSTGALYSPGRGPADESRPLAMSSPYAVSKGAVELQCAYYRSRGIDMVIVRPFNHIGPGQSKGFLVPDLVDAVDALSGDAPLRVGNLDTRRDYTDVRDVAAAYVGLLEAPQVSPVYNIASGRSLSGREILEAACRSLGREVPQTIVDASRIRPTDPQEIVGDASLIRRELGWAPKIGYEQSIADFVASRRPAVAADRA